MDLPKTIWDNVCDLQNFSPTVLLRHVNSRIGRPVTRTRLKDVGDVWLRSAGSDARVFRQIFGRQDYSVDGFWQKSVIDATYDQILASAKSPLIIDLGANNGASALWFATRYPSATIVAVEPDPENASMCRRNTARHRVEVLEAAIGSRPGSVRLTDPELKWAVETIRDEDGAVPVITIPMILADHPGSQIFIVKIDIEGFEADLFAENTDWLTSAPVIMIEPHDWIASPERSSRSFQRTIGSLDYDLLISGDNLIYVRRETPNGDHRSGHST
jgi:FkbM family methyltransferase